MADQTDTGADKGALILIEYVNDWLAPTGGITRKAERTPCQAPRAAPGTIPLKTDDAPDGEWPQGSA